MGNKILKQLIIAVTPKTTYITGTENINKIIKDYHDDPVNGGHPGFNRMCNKIRQKYKWKNMSRDIRQYVKQCIHCHKNKITRHIKEPMTLTETPISAFDIVQIDTIGPLPRSERGNEYAVTIVCDLTKYLVAVPIPSKHASVVAKAVFDNCILTYGFIRTIITDMGTEYKNSLFNELCKLLKIEHRTSTPYHHQTIGSVERIHRTFNEYVRSYISVDKSDWDEWLRYFSYCYNTTPSTVHGYCPFELVFGKKPQKYDFLEQQTITPTYNYEAYDKEVRFRLQVARERANRMLIKSKSTQKKEYDRNTNSVEIKIGDLV